MDDGGAGPRRVRRQRPAASPRELFVPGGQSPPMRRRAIQPGNTELDHHCHRASTPGPGRLLVSDPPWAKAMSGPESFVHIKAAVSPSTLPQAIEPPGLPSGRVQEAGVEPDPGQLAALKWCEW